MKDFRRKCEELETKRQQGVLEIYVDHGARPQGVDCAYFVAMRPERKTVEQWLKKGLLKYSVIISGFRRFATFKITVFTLFFYEAGKLSAGTAELNSSKPASLMLIPGEKPKCSSRIRWPPASAG